MSWASRKLRAVESPADAAFGVAQGRPAASDRTLRSGLVAGLARIGAFLLVALAVVACLDAAISLGLKQLRTGEMGVWNNIVGGRINADVLISGSSRAMSHYDAPFLQSALGRSVYNIGLNGSQTDMQVARLKTYLRHNRPPQAVIHNLDAFTLQVTHGEVYDPGQYLPYIGEPDLYAALARINPETWRWRYLPLYGYATQDLRLGWLFGILQALTGERAETHFQGYRPRDDEWTTDFEQFRAANPNGVNVPVEEAGIRQLEELLEICRMHGIKTILAYSPEFIGAQEMTINRGDILAKFRQIAERHGAIVLDFSGSEISGSQSWFYNSQHLNRRGARLFSEELAGRIAAMLPSEATSP